MIIKRHDGSAQSGDVFMLAHLDISEVPEGSLFEIVASVDFVR